MWFPYWTSMRDFIDVKITSPGNAVTTVGIKLFQNYFGLRWRPTETILFWASGNVPEIKH